LRYIQELLVVAAVIPANALFLELWDAFKSFYHVIFLAADKTTFTKGY
jgi:hypothetical protein